MSKPGKTLLDSQLIASIKQDNNFDFIRFFLAYSVLFNHFSTLTETDPFWFVSGGFRVKGFFIISGFLVMFSFLRSPDPFTFFRKRIQRIMPAYILIIIVCSLLGLLLTSFSYKEYINSPQLISYLFYNIITLNFLNPYLPGVFENNPLHSVNASLWTIKVELMLYLTIPIIYWFIKRYNKLACLIIIYVLSFIYSTTFNHLDDITQNPVYGFLKRQFPGQLMYFCSGIILLIYFSTFKKYMKYIFPICILLFIDRDLFLLKIVEPIALASIIVTVAYGIKYLPVFNRFGNFSYGIFLVHYPIMQTFIHFGLDKYSLLLTLSATVVLSTLLGILSWKYIEKPCLYTPDKIKNS